MIVSDELVARYFAPPREPLWRWSADGSAITTSGGKTIAFKQEVEAVIERLAPRGLPPFGAIVLLLAACRDGWAEDTELRGSIARLSFPTRVIGANQGSITASILRELDRLNQLRPDLRRTPQGKAFLAESIFENTSRRVPGGDAEMIAQGLRRGIPREMLEPVAFEGSEALLADLDVLCNSKLSSAELELRHATGLDETPEPSERDEPLPERARKLLEALRRDDDPELAGMARLALDLLAAVHVPRTLTLADEMPLGGFTDIANRGHLDRLLISELAHDDLTLSVRVALNEALYLRRESPPRTPPRHREILIDSGIRLWGLPRAFAASVALALIASAEAESSIRCFRATSELAREALTPVDLSTRAGLIEHLGVLEAAPHPAVALREFLDDVNGRDEAADAILITHPDVLDDAEFKASLAALPNLKLYVASVDREGQFRLLHFTSSGYTVVREAQYELEALFAPKKKTPTRPDRSSLKNRKIDPTLPVILSVDEFPFLLPHPIEQKRCRFSIKGTLYAVTHDGRLTRRDDPKRGALQMSDKLPRGAVRRIIPDGENSVYVLIDPQEGRNLLLFHAVTEKPAEWETLTRCLPLEARGDVPLDAYFQNGLLVVIYDCYITVYNPGNGKLLSDYKLRKWESSTRPKTWIHGRFFKSWDFHTGKGFWHQLGLSTPSGRVALIDHPAADSIALIERRTDEKGIGPWSLNEYGTLTSTLQGDAVQFDLKGKKITRLVSASDDGNRLSVCYDDGHFGVLDVNTKKVFGGSVWLDKQFVEMSVSRSVRSKFVGVSVNPQGSLVLWTKSGEGFRLQIYRDRNGRIALERWKLAVSNRILFKRCPSPPDTRYTLSVARFPDGSCIYLDSRGLLHLKSSDPSQPEVALVLHDSEVAGWTSAGERCGGEFFCRKNGDVPNAAKVFARISDFVRRLR